MCPRSRSLDLNSSPSALSTHHGDSLTSQWIHCIHGCWNLILIFYMEIIISIPFLFPNSFRASESMCMATYMLLGCGWLYSERLSGQLQEHFPKGPSEVLFQILVNACEQLPQVRTLVKFLSFHSHQWLLAHIPWNFRHTAWFILTSVLFSLSENS